MDVLVVMDGYIAIPLVICEDENNIGAPVFCIIGIGGGATKKNKQYSNEDYRVEH